MAETGGRYGARRRRRGRPRSVRACTRATAMQPGDAMPPRPHSHAGTLGPPSGPPRTGALRRTMVLRAAMADMTKLFTIPAQGEEARKHFEESILKGVELSLLTDL